MTTTPRPRDQPGATRGDAATRASIVDFETTGRRLRRMAIGSVGLIGVVVLALGVAPGVALSWRLVGEVTGWVLLATVVVEVAITCTSALSGMLRAGERGDRLARPDVALLPPQVRRRRR